MMKWTRAVQASGFGGVAGAAALGLIVLFGGAEAARAGAPVLEAATYAGGPGNISGRGVDIAPDGAIYIAGFTDSTALPNALNSKSGLTDIYVMKLSGDLSTILWSRYMGGVGVSADLEFATDCAASPDGGVVVTGKTETPDFPAVNALDSTLGGPSDAVLFKLDADGGVEFSTYLGGSAGENGAGAGLGKFIGDVEVGADGSIFVTGNTRSPDFPLVNPIDDTFGGFNDDVFVTKITPDGQTILASTYLGDNFKDEAWAMHLDAEGRPIIVGNGGPGWPHTAGAYILPSTVGYAFVTKLASDAQSIVWSAVVDDLSDSGGGLDFREFDLAPDGTVVVTGTATGSFPVPPDAFQPMIMQGSPTRDLIALAFSPDGSQITGGTYLGAFSIGEFSICVGVDSFGQVYLVLNRESPGPTRVYKMNPSMTTLLEGPVEIAFPGTTWQVRVEDDNDLLALAFAPDGETTAGAAQEDPPEGGNYVPRWDFGDPPAGGPDLDGDGSVGSGDLAILLGKWGPCPAQGACPADLNGDGSVGSDDLAILLGSWG